MMTNKDLKGTAVKPNNKTEEKAIIALYELAGFKRWGDKLAFEKIPPYCEYITLSEVDFKIFLGLSDDREVITLDQLAWEYNLIPDFYTELRVTDKGCVIFMENRTVGGPTVRSLNDGQLTKVEIDNSTLISTRPKQEEIMKPQKNKPYWPEINEPCLWHPDSNLGWVETKILADLGDCDYAMELNGKKIIVKNPMHFRPALTPDEKKREEFVDKYINKLGMSADRAWVDSISDVIREIYDEEIKEGKND